MVSQNITSVLAGALAAVVVGFFAEPIKNWINNLLEIRRLRLSLYKEIANIYINLKEIERQINNGKINTIETLNINIELISTRCYSHTDNIIILFYQLPEATDIDIIYKVLSALSPEKIQQNSKPINTVSLLASVPKLVYIIEDFRKAKKTDRKLFEQCIASFSPI
ncbi:hypothetical protein [Nostoc sp.]|uniref:hypothetical protein n=1 Tax=Nostoc sp. TaxID=1180 RepID=UPI002FF7052C